MRRRDFIKVIVGSTVAGPLAGQAQQADEVRRISVLQAFDAIDPQSQRRMQAFLQGLQGLGWIEGPNVRIDYRWGGTDPERVYDLLPSSSSSVSRTSSWPATHSLCGCCSGRPRRYRSCLRRLPIRSGTGSSQVWHTPGGNITGLTSAAYPAGAARSLELLTSVAPRTGHATIVLNPDQPSHVGIRHAIEAAARSVNVHVASAEVRTAPDITPAIEASAREPNGGLIVLPSSITTVHRTLIIALAAKHRLPAIYPYRFHVVSGGLISYGADPVDQYRQAASYVDRILRGA